MAAVTSITTRPVTPNPEVRLVLYRYTKGAATDTLDASGEFGVVDCVWAKSAAGVTQDTGEVSSSTTITFASGTGASYCLVAGRGT